MAITKCPDCGWYISDKSLFCVRCGCCFVDFEGFVKSLFASALKESKPPELKEEIKAPIIKQPEIKKPSEQELKDQEIIKSIKIKKKIVIPPPPADDEKTIYTVPELRKVLGISINQAYVLARSKNFPVLHIGNKKVIPIKPFWEWFIKTSDIKKE